MATLVADAFRAAFGRQTLSQTTVAQALASLFGWRGDTPELETSESGQASMGGPPGGGHPERQRTRVRALGQAIRPAISPAVASYPISIPDRATTSSPS